MLGNANIPLPTPSNRRTSRRLWHFVLGAGETLAPVALVLWLIIAPKPVTTTAPGTLSVWLKNSSEDRSFLEQHLGHLSMSSSVTLAEAVRTVPGPYLLIWDTDGQLRYVQGGTAQWGENPGTRQRLFPILPWKTGQVTIVTEQGTIKRPLTIDQQQNRLRIPGQLLAQNGAEPLTSTTILSVTMDEQLRGLWSTLEIPLTFPGLRALAEQAAQGTVSLTIEKTMSDYKTLLTMNRPLSKEAGEALIQDALRGTDNVQNTVNDTNTIITGEKSGTRARVVRTDISTSLQVIKAQTTSVQPAPECLRNPTARINLAELRQLLPLPTAESATNLIIESNKSETALCFVDNSH